MPFAMKITVEFPQGPASNGDALLVPIRIYRTEMSKDLVGQRVWRLFPGVGELLGEVRNRT